MRRTMHDEEASMPLYLNYHAVIFLAYIMLSLLPLFYLLLLKEKSRPTWLMTFFFMGLALYCITLFIFTILPPAYQFWFRPSQYISFLATLAIFLKFVYAFPHPFQGQRDKVEARVVDFLSILAILAAAAMFGYHLYVNASLHHPPQPTFAYQLTSQLFILGLSWTILVLLRRTVRLSEEEEKTPAARSVLQKLVKPTGRPARASRAFALLLATPFGAVIIVAFRDLGIFSQAAVDFIIPATLMVFFFSALVLYLNHAPESSTFMVKLVGASLVIVLVLLAAVGQVFQPYFEKAFRNPYMNTLDQNRTIRFQPTPEGFDVRSVPGRFDSQWGQKAGGQKLVPVAPEQGETTTLDLAFSFPFCGKNREQIHIHKDGIVTFDSPLYEIAFQAGLHIGIAPLWLDLNPDAKTNPGTKGPKGKQDEPAASGIFQKTDPAAGKLVITWANMIEKETGMPRTVQLVLYRGGAIEFSYRNIRGCRPKMAGIFSGRGFSSSAPIHFSRDLPFSAPGTTIFEDFYEDYRRFIHYRVLPLAIMVVMAVFVILLVFPLFFRSVLVKPLQALLEGMRKVKQGRWSGAAPVRVLYNDEIGFLTDSFNHMIQYLEEARKGWLEADKIKDKLLALNRSILETAAEGILTMDRQGKVLSFNKAAEDMFKYSREDVIGKPDHMLLHQPDPDHPMGFLGHFIVSGKRKRLGVEYEFQGKQENGRLFPLEFAVSTTRSIEHPNDPNLKEFPSEGEEIYTVVLHDLTEHQRSAEEKMRLEEQLHQSQKLETIGTLAGGIAHDFNNILTPLIGYTEMAMEDIPPGNPVHNYLENILNSSNRAKELVRQILTFSRKSEEVFEVVEIYPVIKDSLTLLRASTPSSIVFDLNLNPGSGAVFGDRTQLGQVLINLCANATHAMQPAGGTLYITLDCLIIDEQLARQHPRLKQDTYVVLKVKDTGKGMDRATLTHIFEPFFTTKTAGEGTGLGLSVVHGIVNKHGGAVLVDSQPGKGSTFTVYFPSIPTKEIEKIVEYERRRGRKQKRANILLVDDEEMIVDMYKDWLERMDYRVSAETGSLRALEIFRRQAESFDIVILDQTMPQLSGLQLAEHIRAVRPDIPIILYTGNIDFISKKTLKQFGIKKFLIKPVNFAALNRAIQDLLGN
jgi:PAS domain S-box-containing protein